MGSQFENRLESDLFCFVKKFTIYNAMLFIRDLHRITEWRGILFHKFLPVKRFTIVGIVTSVCRREKVMYLKVDDGTASIQCVFFLEYCSREQINEHKWTEEFKQKKCLRSMAERMSTSSLCGGRAKEVELGSLVHLRGDLRHSNGQAELICKKFRELDANDEASYKLLRLQMYKRIYDVKFDWHQLFLDFLKGNPGVWVVRFLRKMKHSCFTKQDLLNLKSQVLEEPLIDVALRDMRHAGFMYKKEETGSIYQIVECDKELQECVFNFLQEESDKNGASAKSVYTHMKPKFPDLGLEHVNLCLKVLESRSDVYATGDKGHFRVV